MSDLLIHYLLRYGSNVASIAIAGVAIWRCRRSRPSWAWPMAIALGLALIARTYYDARSTPNWGHDFRFCWRAGSYSLEGKDPYTLRGLQPPHENESAFYYPPFMLPLFRIFVLVPEETAVRIWTAFNVLISFVLGLMAWRALIAQDRASNIIFQPWIAALLSGPVILSLSARFAIEAGQFSLLVTLALLGALAAQRARPVVAAVCLVVASIKVQTMFPFLLLFLRRDDLCTWILLGLFMAALLLCSGDPAMLPERIQAFLSVHEASRQPGFTGDASLLNPKSHTMIGFDHALSRLGVRDHSVEMPLNYLCMAALGICLGYVAISKPTLPRGALISFVSLYSMLFLYHRLYDLPILIIPLVYCGIRFSVTSGAIRWCYAAVLAAIIFALNVPYGEFYRIQGHYSQHPILTPLVLPSATYLIVLGMGALALAVGLEMRRGPSMHVLRENTSTQSLGSIAKP